jgi:hypothetical protein
VTPKREGERGVSRGMKLRAVAACGAIATACVAHEEVTPAIAVQPGAAARAMALLGHGGPNDPAAHGADAEDGGATTIAPAPSGLLVFSCMEARGAMRALALVPCSVTIAAAHTSDDPSDLVAETGKVSFPAAPGSYHVTASRGMEYARASWDVEVRSGKATWGPNEGATVLARVVDTRGYLAADLHPPDPEDARETVFEDAADGVEIISGDVARIIQAARLADVIEPLDAQELDGIDAWEDKDPYLARIVSKHPVTAIASPPARTYVRVDDDGSFATWSPAREADLVRGVRERRDVVLTNGPFLRVTANGAPIGGVARVTADKDVEVKVHVECAPWIEIDRIAIARASGAAVPPQSVTLRPTPAGARAADATFHLHAAADDAFVVLADSNAHPSAPANVDPDLPRAMTGAIWIDADGDGESLGRR